jgi:hypothetical protein
MENVNKIAGPFIEAWAHEVFSDVLEDENNKYQLIKAVCQILCKIVGGRITWQVSGFF